MRINGQSWEPPFTRIKPPIDLSKKEIRKKERKKKRSEKKVKERFCQNTSKPRSYFRSLFPATISCSLNSNHMFVQKERNIKEREKRR